MKKILKKFIVLNLLIMSLFIGIKPVNATDIMPYSGGLVSTSTQVTSCTLKEKKWVYTDLVDDWAYTSKYIVSKKVTKSSSTTLSIGINAQIKEDLSANYNVSYGITVSTENSIGREIPADKTKYSKLRHKVLMKTYNVKVKLSSKYYDTSLGYYTIDTNYTGTITVPIKGESYIEVYYKK